ncbi:D-malate degradation protein R [Tritonibacter multivorans]|uniref:D-malate degradation protein R n=1 Tax=Tritonibacter multivorans TaxID=928856 RepID=A0A0P1GH03_9RHOB|nr:LysR family transcriptional regulator [Tritonibacter multivorans]MDA7420645.1 LysR family transcriptional regulator [Tritonibacter multivorans]CUH81208.1 D-malate degradation protein R [Tritonibacter multivorans]SFC30853.1 DNA-binding transcriptional regulator, LysR family [Tritonibacter multivorans]
MALEQKNLQLFDRVATLGAIGRAGAEFGLSSTNASERIKALEAELGVTLFHRTTRAVTLTPDGELFLGYVRRILGDMEEARTVLAQEGGAVTGRVKVTAPASFGTSQILPHVPEFLLLYPQVDVDLHFSDAVVDIVGDGYDLAFRIAELEPSSLRAQKVDRNPTWLVASPGYLARAGLPDHPQDLMQHSCLPLGDRRSWRLKGADGQVHEVRVTGQVKSNLGNALMDLALADVGICKISLWQAADHLREGRLIRVLPSYSDLPELELWALRPPGRGMPARVKVFLDFIRDRIRARNRQLARDCSMMRAEVALHTPN